MGNSNEPSGQGGNNKQRKDFLQRVEKVSSGESQIWGDYNIYQQKQKPYDYFLQYMQLAHPQRDFLQKKLAFYQSMPKHKNLVAIQFAEIVKRKELCAQFEALRVFCMYYNFTLENGIRVKIKQRSSFTEGELVYIMRSLLLIGRYYESELKARCYSGIFQSKEVFISPQGHLKIYPFNDNIFSSYLKLTNKSSKETDKNVNSMTIKQETTYECTKKTERRRGRIKTTLNIQSERIGNSVVQMQRRESECQQMKMNGLMEKQSQWFFMHQNTQSTSFTKRESKLSWQESPLNSMRSKPQLSFRGKPQHQHHHPHYLSSLSSTNKLTEREQMMTMRSNGSGRDWFQLGILMMQLILLNDSQDYYYETQEVLTKEDQKYGRRYHQIGFSKMINITGSLQQSVVNQHNFMSSKHALRYQNKEGKKPNLDLIQFSLNNLLPKKNISQTLIQIITLLLSPNHQNLTYGQIITTLEQHQQTLTEPKYCLKFDLQNQNEQTPQIDDKHFSRDIIKNPSVDPFLKTTNLSSRAFINNESSLSSYNYENKFITQPKESFFAKNLDDLVNVNNFTRSMVVQEGEDNNKSAAILNGLKKSRKLVPTKIRSVSNKNSAIHQNNLSKSKNIT